VADAQIIPAIKFTSDRAFFGKIPWLWNFITTGCILSGERKRVEGVALKLLERIKTRSEPIVFHPAVFIGGFVCLGFLFALQSWVSYRTMNYKVSLVLLMEGWGAQYLIWGVLCWLFWLWLGPRIQQATLPWILSCVVPLSIVVSIGEEMIWVLCFPGWPMERKHLTYWQKVQFQLDAEFIDNMLVFWCTFFLIRGVGYYQKYREKEHAAAQLEIEVVQAQMRALRMQLNPHFLFNTLNGISSLMRNDVAGADTMLEQLSSLLRITLERGEIQLIPLSDEMEFVEMYLAIQHQRYAGRVSEQVRVEPELHDALVPAMILQPIIENAYTHGLSLLERDGLLTVEARREGSLVRLTVRNNGVGLHPEFTRSAPGQGVGLTNVRNRLQLHYGDEQCFFLDTAGGNTVMATIMLPLQFSKSPTLKLAGYGA
jgi:two-component system LytT family sensor kinase